MSIFRGTIQEDSLVLCAVATYVRGEHGLKCIGISRKSHTRTGFRIGGVENVSDVATPEAQDVYIAADGDIPCKAGCCRDWDDEGAIDNAIGGIGGKWVG
ncbi:hypothetical protein UVI_02062340 [Ustilaginoidea virens]|uniref:Uncharacterized protein n=1 Tax=Ustilaginoidea virens TaxID=1159556 RepID=A0A1B5L841_USTVR|nr:hypothetical protein UVI_02062340 [Ustilaginoidea virens]